MYYYQSIENGNLLTYEEMKKEAAELYDIDDPTNMLSLSEYYKKTDIEYEIDNNKYGSLEDLNKVIDNFINSFDRNARDHLACYCNGNEAILNALVHDKDDDVRWSVAEHCNKNPKILKQLVHDEYNAVKIAVAEQCDGNEEILKELAKDRQISVLRAVIHNCKGNENVLSSINMEGLNQDDKYSLTCSLIQTGYNLSEYAHSSDWNVRKYVAQNCNHDKNILSSLIKDGSYQVREAVVNNCEGNPEILKSFINDREDKVRLAVVNCCNNNKDILLSMASDKDWAVRSRVVLKCNGDKDVLSKVIEYKTDPKNRYDMNDSVKRDVAKRCNKDEDILRKLSKDESGAIRTVVAEQCNGNEDYVLNLANDDDNSVRYIIAGKAEPTIVVPLFDDDDESVRAAAFMNYIHNQKAFSEVVSVNEVNNKILADESNTVRLSVAKMGNELPPELAANLRFDKDEAVAKEATKAIMAQKIVNKHSSDIQK